MVICCVPILRGFTLADAYLYEATRLCLRHCVISGAGAKYHFLSRVRPLFLYRHHGSHARSRVSYYFIVKSGNFVSFDCLLLEHMTCNGVMAD